MAEQSIKITKRQHDELATLLRQNNALQQRVMDKAQTIVNGQKEAVERFGLLGVDAKKDGTFVMVIDVPKPEKPPKPLKAPRVR